jgi:hypothetical protein
MTQSSTVPPVYDNRLYDQNPSMREIAFHEKAARSQVGSFAFSLDKVFLQPSRHCHHPSIRTLDERFSLGASWAFSFQPVLPPVSDLSSVTKIEVGGGRTSEQALLIPARAWSSRRGRPQGRVAMTRTEAEYSTREA